MVVRAELPCGREPGDQAGLLAVDQGVGAAVPRSSPALDVSEQRHEQHRHVSHVVGNVLKRPLRDNLPLIDWVFWVVGYKAGLVGAAWAQGCWLCMIYVIS